MLDIMVTGLHHLLALALIDTLVTKLTLVSCDVSARDACRSCCVCMSPTSCCSHK